MSNFRNLPAKQSEAFEQIALASDGAEYARGTLKALERKGLIIGWDVPTYGPTRAPMDRIPLMVRRYAVPLPIHAEWCQWCADNLPDDEP